MQTYTVTGDAVGKAVPVKMVSDFYGKDRSSFRKWLIKHGFEIIKVNCYDARLALQPMIAVKVKDLPRIGELRGFTMVPEQLAKISTADLPYPNESSIRGDSMEHLVARKGDTI